MPKVMVNGKEYCGGGGGGDNSQTLTFEAYQALPEETRKNGTTYYVPDAPGEVTGDSVKASNMYYDPATDIKYLKNESGTWVESGKGGLKSTYLIKDGKKVTATDFLITIHRSTINYGAGYTIAPIISSDENSIIIKQEQASQSGADGTVFLNGPIDFTNIDSITIEFSASRLSVVDSYCYPCHIVITKAIKDKYTTDAYAEILSKTSTGNSGKVSIGTKALSGDYYIAFEVGYRATSNQAGTTTCHFYNVYYN